MAGARFDIQFAGELLEGADLHEVRVRLRELFQLSEEAAHRLFGGRPVIIKRGVDTATASRFREVFREAGALVRIVPVEERQSTVHPAHESPIEPGPEATDELAQANAGLHLAPAGHAQPLEVQSTAEPPRIDFSHLTLVPGDDWTLEDCAPQPAPVALPDIGHLTIIVPQDEGTEEAGDPEKL